MTPTCEDNTKMKFKHYFFSVLFAYVMTFIVMVIVTILTDDEFRRGYYSGVTIIVSLYFAIKFCKFKIEDDAKNNL